MIWERVPKTTYVSLTQFRFGVFDAVATFNIGRKASVLIFEKLSMIPGRYCTKGCANINRKRLFNSSYKNKESSKKRRKVIRGQSKSKSDKTEQKEGSLYEPGAF
jgi:hypothetical protein